MIFYVQYSFIADDWSPCSVTCGEGVRHRAVRCKIFLEFSRTIADLPDHQCSGPKPMQMEKCSMGPCLEDDNRLAYRVDPAGESSYAESSLTDNAFRSAISGSGASSGGSTSYESNVKVAPGSSIKTTYSWKEVGYTDCSATCLGGNFIAPKSTFEPQKKRESNSDHRVTVLIICRSSGFDYHLHERRHGKDGDAFAVLN